MYDYHSWIRWNKIVPLSGYQNPTCMVCGKPGLFYRRSRWIDGVPSWGPQMKVTEYKSCCSKVNCMNREPTIDSRFQTVAALHFNWEVAPWKG
jgi:hypothetical protein